MEGMYLNVQCAIFIAALNAALGGALRCHKEEREIIGDSATRSCPEMVARRRITGSRNSAIASVDTSGLRCRFACSVRKNLNYENKRLDSGDDERM